MRLLGLVLLLTASAFAQSDLPLWGVGSKAGGGGGACPGHTYSTSFPNTESPISEGGCWTNLGQFGWNNINTTTNFAQGSVVNGTSGLGDTKDSTALANGIWGNDTQISTVAKTINKNSVSDEEIEHRHRTVSSLNNTTGYEFQWFPNLTTTSCATQINAWNGAVHAFTLLDSHSGTAYCINDGDTLTSTVVGTTLRQFINGVKITEITDATYASGKPGIGIYFVTNGSGALTDFGHKSFRATDTPLLSKSHCSADNATGATIACAVNTTGTGCMGVVVYWNSTTATASVSGSTSGAFTSAVGPTTILGTYRMQLFSKCGYTTNAADTITATISTSGIDHGIGVSAIQGVTALDQVPAIGTGTSTTMTSSTTAAVTGTDEYVMGACVAGNVYGGLPALPNRFTQIESASFGGNVIADGISTVLGSTIQFTALQNASATFGCGVMTFK